MPPENPNPIEGQLNSTERGLLIDSILSASKKPNAVLEVGTWLGGGSTLHFLRALQQNGHGHLWGIEADPSIYNRMIENIRRAVPEALHRFTPLFGFSHQVIPNWLAEQGPQFEIDVVFLDGGNNPNEQILEFHLLNPHIPVGGVLMAHDAKMRKGKWLVPYLTRLDNWKSKLHDSSEVGLFYAKKTAAKPSMASLNEARSLLLRMRLEPAEIAAAILPRQVCGFILKLLPGRLSHRLAEGVK